MPIEFCNSYSGIVKFAKIVMSVEWTGIPEQALSPVILNFSLNKRLKKTTDGKKERP